MPTYTIHIQQGSQTNSHPVDLPDVDAARREAIATFADLARDIASNLPNHPDWRIEVVEQREEQFFVWAFQRRTRHSLFLVSMDIKNDRGQTERKIAIQDAGHRSRASFRRLRQFRNVERGIAKRDEVARVGQLDRIEKRLIP
jgi:hypothetical protein